MTENYILESLVHEFEVLPRYWTSGNQAEVDFLVQYQNEIIPIEVKADENVKSKSLFYYRKAHSPKVSIRFSLQNLKNDDGLVNIPLFMADNTQKILEILHQTMVTKSILE